MYANYLGFWEKQVISSQKVFLWLIVDGFLCQQNQELFLVPLIGGIGDI